MATPRLEAFDADLDFQGFSHDPPVDLPADDFATGFAPSEPEAEFAPSQAKRARRGFAPQRGVEPAPPGPLPLRVCLVCGAEPGGPSECPHDEVLSTAAASPAMLAAALKLAHLAQERRSQERALRRLAGEAVAAGEAVVALRPAVAPEAPRPAPVPIDPTVACPRCGMHPEMGLRATGRASRRGAAAAQQGLFAFAACAPEAPGVAAAAEPEGQPPRGDRGAAPEPGAGEGDAGAAPKRRRRARQAVASDP